MTLHIEHDDDGGCFRLIDDGVGLCISKSRNVLVRIRDALNAVGQTGLQGLTVKHQKDTIPNRVDGYPRGVVLALVSGPPQLVVRRVDNNALDVWHVTECVVVEPEKPKRDTPSNEPGLGVHAACELLKRFLLFEIDADGVIDADDATDLIRETRTFLAARAAAEPIP